MRRLQQYMPQQKQQQRQWVACALHSPFLHSYDWTPRTISPDHDPAAQGSRLHRADQSGPRTWIERERDEADEGALVIPRL